MYIIYTNNFQAPSDILKGNQSSIFFLFLGAYFDLTWSQGSGTGQAKATVWNY